MTSVSNYWPLPPGFHPLSHAVHFSSSYIMDSESNIVQKYKTESCEGVIGDEKITLTRQGNGQYTRLVLCFLLEPDR